MTRIYLAGPMTGHPQFNFPAFDAAAADLRERGYEVVSPAELDSPEWRAYALQSETGDASGGAKVTGETWADLLARDLKVICDGGIEAVVCLPGWQKSKGARLETFVANAILGLPVYVYVAHQSSRAAPIPRTELVAAWAGRGAHPAPRAVIV